MLGVVTYKPKVCEGCGAEFVPTTGRQRFHEPACGQNVPRRCPDCGKTKPADAFYERDGRPVGYCKPCAKKRADAYEERMKSEEPERYRAMANASAKAWRDRNPEKLAASLRKQGLRRYYGLTPEQYQSMLDGQGGVCAICGGTEKRRNLDVDHDRSCCPGRNSCGECVRGLLCNACNMGLGKFGSDPERLEAAARYLRSLS